MCCWPPRVLLSSGWDFRKNPGEAAERSVLYAKECEDNYWDPSLVALIGQTKQGMNKRVEGKAQNI